MHQRDQILENNSKGYREGEVHLHQASSYTVERDMHALEEICNAVSLRKIDHVTYFENYKVVRPPPTTTLLSTPLPITIYTMAPSTAAETSKPKQRSDLLRFSTHRHLRQRILLSVLSGKSLRIDNIRSDDVHVGLRDYEVNLLRLVEKVTNGSTIEISVTGM